MTAITEQTLACRRCGAVGTYKYVANACNILVCDCGSTDLWEPSLVQENEALRQIIREAIGLVQEARDEWSYGDPEYWSANALLERMRAAAGEGKEQE
jgi:hypothetical protein